jgi:hypothetical protein
MRSLDSRLPAVKLVAITKSFTKLVDEDFTWKDPKSAERVRMPKVDYAIGGIRSEL